MAGVLLQRSDGYIPAALALLSGFVAAPPLKSSRC